MQEIATGEIHRNKVEISGNKDGKYFNQEIFDMANDLGHFYFAKLLNHLGDWRIAEEKDRRKTKSNGEHLYISKNGKKQKLSINYEGYMTGLDFMLSDGKTTVSLTKNKDGKLTVVRMNKEGETISGPENLSLREYIEISNFPVKFWLDRNVNAIVNKVYPDKVIRYVVPASAMAIVAVSLGSKLLKGPEHILTPPVDNRPVLTQTVETPIQTVNVEKPIKVDLPSLPTKRESIYKAAIEATKANQDLHGLSNIEELMIIDKLLISGNGKFNVQKIRAYFQAKNSNGLYQYRADSRGGSLTLVKPLEDALKTIKDNSNSQRSIFALLDALNSYDNNSIGSLITPEKVMIQAGYKGSTDNISAQQIIDLVPNNYNTLGSIEAYRLMFETVTNGDLFVYPKDKVVGKIISVDYIINEANEVVDGKILVWTYDQATGKVKIIQYTAKDFPNGEALGFR